LNMVNLEALDPRKDSIEMIYRGLYVATLSIKLR
jgi:hypothetical protein